MRPIRVQFDPARVNVPQLLSHAWPVRFPALLPPGYNRGMDIVIKTCAACGATIEPLALRCQECSEPYRAPARRERIRYTIAKMVIIPIVSGTIFAAFFNFPWAFIVAFAAALIVWAVGRHADPDDDEMPDDASAGFPEFKER